jgi:cation:H+ antiporter
MFQFILLAVGFAILIYGANLLVNSASALADSLNIPKIVIGLTVVAFGTSAPELVVNVFAALQNSPGIALGNVAGSNLFNIMVILGVSAIVYPLVVKSNTTWVEIPLCLLSAVLLIIFANDAILDHGNKSEISRSDGILLLLFFVIFIYYNLQLAKKGDVSDDLGIKKIGRLKAGLLILAGLVLLVAGGRMIVFSALQLAENFGISQRIIALTIISAGTSLPELATSVVAAARKNTDIAIGNIVGSNIFNVFLVLGATAVIRPVSLPTGANIDLLLNIAVSLMLFVFIFTGKGRRIDRWEGVIFIVLYAGYLGYLILG